MRSAQTTTHLQRNSATQGILRTLSHAAEHAHLSAHLLSC